MWRIDDPQGAETEKVKYDVVEFTRGKGVDVGCGPHKGFAHWIGVDNMHHAHMFGWEYKPDVVSNADDLSIFGDNSLDFVYSSHTLEHVEEPRKVLAEWWRVVKPGGHLVLYLPHADLYPNIGQEGANPDHKSDFLPKDVTNMMKALPGWDLVVDEVRNYDKGPGKLVNEYSFLQVYQKTETKRHYYTCRQPKPKKTACVVRYGGFGDMLQAASVCPELKKQGFHVTFITTPKGQDILKHDPHIDQFIIQDQDQVPNNDLGKFFESRAKYYDRFINLCESVEGGLLAQPGRVIYTYPKALRHQICNVNYLERTHDIAEVPHEFHARFYPSEQEKQWVDEQRAKMGDIVVLWSLRGSAKHKVSPYVDDVIKMLMEQHDNVDVVTVGDYSCQILEGATWRNEPRVHNRSGQWTIRQTLAFSVCGADIVVGPETGVTNAAGFETTPVVIALSHSTEENLTKHWINTTALLPVDEKGNAVLCWPCHKMHYEIETCQWIRMSEYLDDDSGEEVVALSAACCWAVKPDNWYNAIDQWIERIKQQWPLPAAQISQ